MEEERRKYQLTQKDLEHFAKKVSEWQTLFGLFDWEITVQWDDDPNTKNEASCSYNIRSRRATIYLAKFQFEKLTKRDLGKDAFHEIGHLLLARMCLLAGSDHIDEFDIDEESHVILSRLTNLIFERD